MTRFGIVSVHYHPRFLRRTLDVLTDIGSRLTPACTVCVANQPAAFDALQNGGLQPGADVKLLQHDNAGLEFGGYQAGYDHLRQHADVDWVLFVNDTVENTINFAPQYRERVREWMASEVTHPVIVGIVESLARSFQIQGIRTHRWVRTHAFALNRAALGALGQQVYRADLDGLVREARQISGFFSDELDPVLRDHLEVWLFHTRPGPHWYKRADLDSDAAAQAAARKARAILTEKYLSVRLDGASAAFHDFREMGPMKKVLRKLDDMAFKLRRDAH